MLDTLEGMFTLERLEQTENIPLPIVVKPSVIITFFRPVQAPKTLFPKLVTLLGMVTLVRLVQLWKA
jgi:hypothetical protein